MKKFFNKRSKKVIDQAIRTLTKLQKPFAIISLFLILSGAFFAPIVHAYNVWNDPVQTVEKGENNETSPMELYDQVDSSMIPIEKEIERFRDENHKVFLKKDGSYEVSIYNDPVHYKEEDQFIEIDNTLVDLGKYYTNQQNNFNIYFPKALNKNESIKIKQDDYQIEWKLNDTKDSKAKKGDKVKKSDDQTILDHLNSSLKYQDAFKDTDLEYVLKSNKVKENIYLKKYHEDISYTFEYKLKNLSLELIKGVYYFVNQAGDALYSLDDLYMIDDQGIISYDVKIEVEQKSNNKYFVKIIPDDTFLKEASYPVLIDPTITLSRQSPVISDTFVVENYPYENYHNMPTMEVGYVGSSGGRRDILMKFEIPSFITSNEVITYSHLNLTRTDDTYSDLQINVHKNVNNFTPSNVTWETKPNYYNEVIDYYSYKYVYAPIHFDISKTVKEWHENGNNYGFTISPEKYVASVKRIYQSQASYEVRPVVKIGYESKGGLKNYWTYSSQELGGAGTGYISDFTGNLVFVRNEYHLDNEYLPLTLSFYHNTLSRNINIGYGRGQKTNYNYKILLDNNVNQYYLETPDGNKVYFHNTYSDQSEYPYQWDYSLAEDGSRWELFQEFYQGSLTYATITTPERIKYEFDHLGRLSQVIDQNTYHSIRINYLSGDMISGITDSAGNRIQFTYSSNQLFLTELQLKQPDGSFRTVEKRSYSYQGGNVSAVNLSINYNKNTNNLSYVSTFYYGYEENRLVSAYSSLDDYKVLYTYNASNKVTHMSLTDNNYNLSDISISYDYLKTTYTNHKNEWVSYLFDNYGHTINILDSNLNASYFRYANPYSYINIHSNLNGYDLIDQKPNYLINHKLIEASDALKQTHNYLSNHGFENISGLSPWALNNQTGRVDVDNEIRLLGDKSLRVYSQTGVNQSIMLKAGFYRLSVWVKNKDVSGGGRVRVQINSETISKATSKMGEWEELTLDFNLSKETTITIYLENTKTDKVSYFDNISLTEGFIDTRYNALENHSFENGLNNWETRGAGTTLNTETGEMAKIFGKNHLKIQGNTNESRYARQVITNFLTEGETYMIGAWAKANASPNTAINGINRGRFFSLEV
ncbi:MAG: DNRLRE domain-containing protein, partial [Candidatus Phytoplasma sp.]|nr:DNRLRE domain-containing protein [Phytoplasma sp.]